MLLADVEFVVQSTPRSASGTGHGRLRHLSLCGAQAVADVSIGGALIHVADHTQRHVGQVVTTTKVLRALASIRIRDSFSGFLSQT
jgi:hypothetical protein